MYITYEEILERMLERIPKSFDRSEGSIIYDALAPAALELQLMYIEFENILKQSFADTASREYLIRRAYERAFFPYPSSSAVFKGIFTFKDGKAVDIKDKEFSIGTMRFTVTGRTEDGNYEVTCKTPGTIGNSYTGRLIPVNYIEGLESAVLTEKIVDGEDEEETEDFRERYLKSFEGLSFGGNVQYYIDKTNEIDGVGGTKVIPVWKGGGTVKLIIF